MDHGGDGLVDLPLAKNIPAFGTGSGSENLWQIDWQRYDANGEGYCVMSTYHNNSDRWYLELPSQWDGVITMGRQEHTTIGERAVVFAHWKGEEEAPERFLTIYRLTGNNRALHAVQDDRFVLWEDSDTVYAAEFHQNSWDCGIDREALLEAFHTT